jgi:subtilase family serine protease
VAAAFPASAAAATPIAVPDSHPTWATSNAKVADAPASAPLTFRVYLNSPNEAAAESLAQAVSTPGNALFRKYLSPAQVKAQFAPTQATVDAVSSWLNASGFRVADVAANNAYVEATGTVSQADQTFNVRLGLYKVLGQVLRASQTDLTVPAAVSSDVLSVVGLDQSESLLKPDLAGGSNDVTGSGSSTGSSTPAAGPAQAPPPPAGFRNAQPCGAYYGQTVDTTDPSYAGQQLPYSPCGYTPEQMRSAYGVNQLLDQGVDGSGTTVAIVDAFASPTLYQDAAEYAQRNDPAHPLTQSQFKEDIFPPTVSLEPPDQCDASGWYGEQTLDVEAVHAMAPGAHILYVGGSDCEDPSLDKALNDVVANHLANEVSNSYGDQGEALPQQDIRAFNKIATQAVIEGIGLYFSSGDSGDEVANLGYPSPDFSASDPWVTAVGGTSTGIGANGKISVVTGWETGKSTLTNGAWTPPAPGNYLYGAGGGTSRLFNEPFYQKGVVPTALANENQKGHGTGRVVPDISMDADPNTGFLIGITQTFPDGVYYDQYRIGGTSLASPLFAGEVAVADDLSGYHHGFINPELYQVLAGSPAIRDVKPVNGGVVRVDYVDGLDPAKGYVRSVRSFNYPNITIHTTDGYDNVTGLGTPNGESFLFLL